MLRSGPFTWKTVASWGFILLLFYMLFSDKSHPILWVGRLGALLILVGLFIGAVQSVAWRVRGGHAVRSWAARATDDEDDFQSHHHIATGALVGAGVGAFAGLMVNVDGTPMQDNGMVDVMGKAFGDSGADVGVGGFAGPMVNVDGTPMQDDGMFDLMGKAFGDSGDSFDHDFSAGMSVDSFSMGMDSSGAGGSDW